MAACARQAADTGEGGDDRWVAIALGSNLGSRELSLARAREAIAARLGPLARISRIYETDPVGPPDQPRYLNQVVLLRSARAPEELLGTLLEIESELGRTRGRRWGPRTIDIDLLLCGTVTHSSAQVTVPHPRMHMRAFVLAPLAELLPEWRHPLHGASVVELLAACGRDGIKPYAGGPLPAQPD